MEVTFTVTNDVTRILGELEKLQVLHPVPYYDTFIMMVKQNKQVVLTDSYDLDETNKLYDGLIQRGIPVMRKTEYNLIFTHSNIDFALDIANYTLLAIQSDGLIKTIAAYNTAIPDLTNYFNYPIRSYIITDDINAQRLLDYAPNSTAAFNNYQIEGRAIVIISYFDAIDSIRSNMAQLGIASANLDMDRLVITEIGTNLDVIYCYIILAQKFRAMDAIRSKY
jgi:hypothetical protein